MLVLSVLCSARMCSGGHERRITGGRTQRVLIPQSAAHCRASTSTVSLSTSTKNGDNCSCGAFLRHCFLPDPDSWGCGGNKASTRRGHSGGLTPHRSQVCLFRTRKTRTPASWYSYSIAIGMTVTKITRARGNRSFWTAMFANGR